MAADPAAMTVEVRREQIIPMTYTSYLRAFAETTQVEWVDGKAIVFMPPSVRHQEIVVFLAALLTLFVRRFGLGQVLTALTEMKLGPEGSAREPDLLFVAAEHRARITEQRIAGPADLVIEIVLPESAARDRSDKFDEYQQAGVREYWIVDPRPGLERADFWVLDAQGKYRPVPPDETGIYRSTILPDFWLDTHWFWREELPDPLHALAQILGPDGIQAALQDAGVD
jgi:Uma2 family endonuclease